MGQVTPYRVAPFPYAAQVTITRGAKGTPCSTLLGPFRSSVPTSGAGCPSRGVVCTAVPEGGTERQRIGRVKGV